MRFTSKIRTAIRDLIAELTSKEFTRIIRHNRQLFSKKKMAPTHSAPPIILMEINKDCSSHIAYSYLGSILKEIYKADIIAYHPYTPKSMWNAASLRIRILIGRGYIGVYKSFGASQIICVRISKEQRKLATILVSEKLGRIKTKRDIEQIEVDGIRIGDLIYDSFLRYNSVPTIDFLSKKFKEFLQESIEVFLYWRDYFSEHNVAAISVSHCVYNLAIPLRIAVARGVPGFQAHATHVYRLTKESIFAYKDFVDFRSTFASFPEDVRIEGAAEAKRRIDRRFKGEVGVDMFYSTKSSFGPSKYKRLLAVSDRKKILIATHCFFDSPHIYGLNLFPDFYEWLEFLGEISTRSDYDWYIKTHPDYRPGTMETLQKILGKYPKLSLLPPDASHHQIIAEGIDVVLTVYGTIGFEYAALGVPVINASTVNPHIAYPFNHHPRSVDEYQFMLMNLSGILRKDVSYNEEIYEYYFMRNVYNTNNIFFRDYKAMLEEVGGYRGQFTPSVYNLWCDEWTSERHEEIREALRRFVHSGDFRMDYRHLGQEITVDWIRAQS